MRLLIVPFLLFLAACSGDKATPIENFKTIVATLPDGQKIRCEMMIREADVQRGAAFRDSLPPDRGLLLIHRQTGPHAVSMYQVQIPLDVVWLDADKRVIAIARQLQPCKGQECPGYSGPPATQSILELAAGTAAKNNLKIGDVITF